MSTSQLATRTMKRCHPGSLFARRYRHRQCFHNRELAGSLLTQRLQQHQHQQHQQHQHQHQLQRRHAFTSTSQRSSSSELKMAAGLFRTQELVNPWSVTDMQRLDDHELDTSSKFLFQMLQDMYYGSAGTLNRPTTELCNKVSTTVGAPPRILDT